MTLPLIAAEVVGSIALPYILKALGKKALPALAKSAMRTVTRVPVGMVLAQVGSEAPALFSKRVLPAGAVLLQGEGTLLRSPMKIAGAASDVVGALGKGAHAVGAVGSYAAPVAMSLLGRGVQAASVGGGALLGAAARLPLAINQTPAESKARYGTTPTEQVGEFIAGLGDAAGIGASAVGSAVGSTISDSARELQLMDLQKNLHARTLSDLSDISELGVRPSDAALYAQLLRSQGRIR